MRERAPHAYTLSRLPRHASLTLTRALASPRREAAAARVLDPVLAYAHLPVEGSDERPPYGLFWKDYKISEW